MRWLACQCSEPSSVIVIGPASAAEAEAELRAKNGEKRTVAYATPGGVSNDSKVRLRLAASAIAEGVPPEG